MKPRGDMETIKWYGDVWGETPALCHAEREVRRRDVGVQKYGASSSRMPSVNTDKFDVPKKTKAAYKFAPTSNGSIGVPHSEQQIQGSVPTAEVVLFLRNEYLGTRDSDPPTRYYKR